LYGVFRHLEKEKTYSRRIERALATTGDTKMFKSDLS
jgi:Na+-driven multidrug efflux pump